MCWSMIQHSTNKLSTGASDMPLKIFPSKTPGCREAGSGNLTQATVTAGQVPQLFIQVQYKQKRAHTDTRK